MKKWIFLTLAVSTLIGWQLPLSAVPKHKYLAKVTAGPLYIVGITASAWEGLSARIKLTLAGHTVVDNTPIANSPSPSVISLRVTGLKSGTYTATVTLLKTDLLNTDAKNQIQTIIEYGMYAYGAGLRVISEGDHSFPNPSISTKGFDESMAWGKDPAQIPNLPLGQDSYARYRIGDTCKIVFFVGPPSATIPDVEPEQAPDLSANYDLACFLINTTVNFHFLSGRHIAKSMPSR